ncbi:hypothetical protein Tco_0116564 [Tanacetum coccineum]
MTTSKLPSLIGIRSNFESWSDGIRPKGFPSSVLLWLVIIIAVVGVDVTVVVVVVESSSVVKLFVEDFVGGLAKEFHQDRASSVKVPVANFTLQSLVQLLWENTDSVRSNQRISPIAPFVPLKLIAIAIVAACASRAVATLSATTFLMVA